MGARKTFSAADKAKWAEEKTAKVARAKALLTDGVRALQTSDDWKGLLTRVARSARCKFRVSRYSFANQILVEMQAPGATMCAGFKQWISVGRNVKKGERSIMIRQPKPFSREREREDGETETVRGMAFGVASVFTYEQTEGEAVTELPKLCEQVPADAIFASSLDALRDVARAIPGDVVASLEIRERRDGDPTNAAGWYCRADRSIVVVENGNGPEMFATLAHELGHAIMHGAGDHHDTRTKEVEAESVAFIVCNAVGLDTSAASFPYVATWAGKNTDAAAKVLESGERITRAAGLILDALYGATEAEQTEEREAA
jgi:antirestriction protein ArdC